MAKSPTSHNLCYNPPLGSEDELVEDLPEAPTKGSNTPTLSLVISQAQTPTLAPALAPNFTKKLCQ